MFNSNTLFFILARVSRSSVKLDITLADEMLFFKKNSVLVTNFKACFIGLFHFQKNIKNQFFVNCTKLTFFITKFFWVACDTLPVFDDWLIDPILNYFLLVLNWELSFWNHLLFNCCTMKILFILWNFFLKYNYFFECFLKMRRFNFFICPLFVLPFLFIAFIKYLCFPFILR